MSTKDKHKVSKESPQISVKPARPQKIRSEKPKGDGESRKEISLAASRGPHRANELSADQWLPPCSPSSTCEAGAVSTAGGLDPTPYSTRSSAPRPVHTQNDVVS